MPQFVTRVDDATAAAVDEMVAEGIVISRSEAVRLGLRSLVEQHRRRRVGQEIVRAYQARPQSDGEVGWADEATVRMIAEEPW